MKILYIADGRSPTATQWIGYFIHAGHEVHMVTTYPSDPMENLASMTTLPTAFSGAYGQSESRQAGRGHLLRKIIPVNVRTRIRQLLVPLSLPRAAKKLQGVIEHIQPELIHAMRIPYEGMIASMATRRAKMGNSLGDKAALLISVWGNDFTLHARSTPLMAAYTRQALENCDALHTDCQRDLRLAREMGFAAMKPGIVMPGSGGVKLDMFYPPKEQQRESKSVTIINPRGFRSYVRNDTFFKAIPLVWQKMPGVRFVCPGMAGEAQAQKWIRELGISAGVELMPLLSLQELAGLFRQSQINLSISTHDGTPNSLLQAMASGCFPIAGDIESIREWIAPGVNGMLVDPGDAEGLALAIIDAISDTEFRKQARERNLQIVRERAEYGTRMREAEGFYQSLVSE